MKIEIYDTTLREGAQRAGVIFSAYEKLKIIGCLDRLGVSYIETGFYGPGSPRELLDLPGAAGQTRAKLSLLCPTVKPGAAAADCPYLANIAASGYPAAAVVGKASRSQVTEVLGTDADENLRMIRDTVRFLTDAGLDVTFDAEHFFDGYSEDPDYARAVVSAAFEAGARTVTLCDTNGGMLPDVISLAVESVAALCAAEPDRHVGIHCHNDCGMADACSVSAVLAGACAVQCTVTGIGERCGNANLSTVVPVLQLKLGYSCIPPECMKDLSAVTRTVCQTANLGFDDSEPFVGGHAFLHKAGLHIDAVRKSPSSFEHIDPALVGNERNLVISELSGRAAVTGILNRSGISCDKDSPELSALFAALRDAQSRGCQYDNSEASLQLLVWKTLGLKTSPFELLDFKLLFSDDAAPESRWSAIVKFRTPDGEELRVGEGDGPVNALDVAAHLALRHVIPGLDRVKMVDIKARIDSNDAAASASIVRVFVESGDGENLWRTMGASTDIIAASWQALLDAYEYYAMQSKTELSTEQIV